MFLSNNPSSGDINKFVEIVFFFKLYSGGGPLLESVLFYQFDCTPLCKCTHFIVVLREIYLDLIWQFCTLYIIVKNRNFGGHGGP